MAVCSICRLVQNLKEVKWTCPQCEEVFFWNKIKTGNKKGFEVKNNNSLLKPISTLDNDKEINEKK
jgi:hypothetical protein